MRIGRVACGLDVRRVVVEQIEYEMALMFVGADDLGVDRHVVGNQGAGAHPLVQAEVLGRITGIESVDLGLEALAVAAGMQLIADVEELEGRQLGRGITYGVIGSVYGVRAQITACGGDQRCVAQARDLGHFAQAHVGAVGHYASQYLAQIRRVLDGAIHNMANLAHPLEKVKRADPVNFLM